MNKNFKKYCIVVLFALLISSSMCGLIPDFSSTNLNQGSQLGLSGSFPSNPFGFNPFQGVKFDDKFFKTPQLFQKQTTLQQQPSVQ
jgi:hypothetical protein